MEFPFISCKCITYGRVNFLEESLYSFLNQDYPGKKELIIVNDYPLQTLVFEHPDVKIYNLDYTFNTIGENGLQLSVRPSKSFAVSKSRISVLVDSSCPNLINIGPKDSRYFANFFPVGFLNKPCLMPKRNIFRL